MPIRRRSRAGRRVINVRIERFAHHIVVTIPLDDAIALLAMRGILPLQPFKDVLGETGVALALVRSARRAA